MADQLKQAYRHIDADPDEMARYRDTLRQRLVLVPKRSPWRRWLWAPLVVGLAALLVFLLQNLRQPALRDMSLDEIGVYVHAPKTDRAQLKLQAWSDFKSSDPQAHRNGTVALCLILPTDEAIEMAAEHLMAEDNPFYRAFLLERILDLADDHGFDIDHIEALMDREENAYCLTLYRDWLKLT